MATMTWDNYYNTVNVGGGLLGGAAQQMLSNQTYWVTSSSTAGGLYGSGLANAVLGLQTQAKKAVSFLESMRDEISSWCNDALAL